MPSVGHIYRIIKWDEILSITDVPTMIDGELEIDIRNTINFIFIFHQKNFIFIRFMYGRNCARHGLFVFVLGFQLMCLDSD